MSNKHSPDLICSKIVNIILEMEIKIGEVEQLLRQLETSATTDRIRDEFSEIDRKLDNALKATIQARSEILKQ